jgi:hypothetical protein
MRPLSLSLAVLLLVVLAGCGGGEGGGVQPPSRISASISPASLTISQDGTPAKVDISTSGTSGGVLTVTASGAPGGVVAVVTQLSTGSATSAPSVTFHVSNSSQAPAGNYTVTFRVSDGGSSTTAQMTLTVAVAAQVATVSSQHSHMFLSTSFQPADWSYQFFQTNTVARQDALNKLGPRHINLQPMDGATDSLRPGLYDFTKIDAIVQPVLQVTDGSPLLQLYAPAWMWVNGDTSKGMIDPTFNQFADWAATLVKYYNTPGGFTDSVSGKTFVSPAGKPIEWWGVFNEPNLTSMTPQQYVALYNLTAQKMLAVDPTIKLVGIELSDWGNEPQRYLPAFVAGVTQPVHALATHYYGSCNQKDKDTQVVNTVTGFHDHVQYFYSQMATKPALANLPVWVTENNVNADWSNNGVSACNSPQTFLADPRGTSAFFAGWRPYVFSQLTKAGAQSLHHWDYNADQQYGEVDGNNGQTLLSYWADYWLGQVMTDVADPTQSGIDLLPITSTETSPELLAVRKSDGTVAVMVANYAVANSGDNNGAGAPRSVVIDTSAIGTFKSAKQVTIDATTSATTGPTATAVTPASKMTVMLNGYGVTFLELVP